MSRPNIFKSNGNSKNNNRFSFIDEELNLEQKPKINEKRNEGPNLFSRQLRNTVSQPKSVEQPKIQDDLNTFPLLVIGSKEKEKEQVTFPILSLSKTTNSDIKNQEPNPLLNNSYSKAIRRENVVIVVEEDKDEVRRKSVKPGWVSIFKNKSGKTEIVYGPKTEEEKQKAYQDSSMNYQMYLAITRMEERWKLEKQRYDAIHGQNAYNDSYGYTPTYESDDDYDDEESDCDSDYEYE